MTQTNGIKKKFLGYLLLNWKTKEITVRKRMTPQDKKSLSPHLIPIKIDIDIYVPDQPLHEMKGSIEMPEANQVNIFLDAME